MHPFFVLIMTNSPKNKNKYKMYLLTLEALRRGQFDPPPLDFFGFKFLHLDNFSLETY